MSFIHPLLLGGLLLVGIPVLLHLVMRQKPKHLLFPALRFLQQRHRTNQRKLQLRHLLLLALRMLLIAAICLALARPRIFSQRLNLAGDRPVAAVMLFDTSLSMEYTLGGRSRLDEAKRRALELLDELPDGSRVAVLDSAEQGGEWTPALATVREQIAGLQLRPANFAVTRQVGHAYDLLARLEQEQARPEEAPLPFLYVFSDRTQASWDPGALETLQRLRQHIEPAVNAVLIDVGVDKPVDLAVTGVEVKPREVIPANGRVELQATVQATGEGCDTEIVCRLDGKEGADRKPVKLEAGQSQVFTFERQGLAEGWHQAEVVLKAADSTVAFDNARFATFLIRGSRKALVLTDDPGSADFWKATLETPTPMGVFTCDVATTADAGKLFPDTLRRDYQAIFLLSVAAPGNELWQKLDRYVKQGGGLAILPGGEELQPRAYNDDKSARLLMPGKLVKIVTSPEKLGVDWDWKENNYQHPLMKPFGDWRQDSSFNLVQYPRGAFRSWEVQPYDDPAARVVNYADPEKRPAILETPFDRKEVPGRVLLFTTALDGRQPRWNNYLDTLDNSFYLLLAHLSAGYLAGDADEGHFNHLSGQLVPVRLPAEPRFPTYTIQGPGLTGSEAIVPRADNQNDLSLAQPVLPGNYTLFGADGNPTAYFSLNVPPEECQLARVPPEQIEALFGPGSVLPTDRQVNLHELLQNHWSQPIELLPWLLILLLLVLAIENLLANKFYRQPRPETVAA